MQIPWYLSCLLFTEILKCMVWCQSLTKSVNFSVSIISNTFFCFFLLFWYLHYTYFTCLYNCFTVHVISASFFPFHFLFTFQFGKFLLTYLQDQLFCFSYTMYSQLIGIKAIFHFWYCGSFEHSFFILSQTFLLSAYTIHLFLTIVYFHQSSAY